MRVLAWIVGVLVALVAAVVIALPPVADSAFVRGRVADAVRAATGRDLALGEIGLSLFPPAAIEVSEVRLANVPGAAAADMVSVASLSVSLDALALIGGEVAVQSVVIRDPVIRLEATGERPSRAMEAAQGEPAPRREGAPPRLTIGELRIENGTLSYRDAAGETVAESINVTLAAPAADAPLTLKGGMTLNGEPVELDLVVDTFGEALAGERFSLSAAVNSKLISAGYEGAVQRQPLPGLDGDFDLDIASVGALAAWLGRPLPEDPGPLKVAAKLVAEGRTVALTEAVIEGESLSATAFGSLEAGEVTKVVFRLDGDRLDIDRYLPKPAKAPMDHMPAPAAREEGDAERDLFAAVPDEPFDLSALRALEADVAVRLGGVSAMGYEAGPIEVSLATRDGALTLEVAELGLYGGKIDGHVTLAPEAEGLRLDVALAMDGVALGKVPAAIPVVGTASAMVAAHGRGLSPRALAQSLSGRVDLSLGGVEATEALAAISELSLSLDLPGIDAAPSLAASVVYNGERVDVTLATDPLPEVLGGDRFNVDLGVSSRLIEASYEGAVQQRPAPALDGSFALDVGSVGKLAAWLGRPLDQPDPGPLKVRATAAADGARLVLSAATIEGEGLTATASGSVDRSGPVRKIDFTVEADTLDIDRYLPPPAAAEEAETAETAAPAEPAPTADRLAMIPDMPFDLAHMRAVEGAVSLRVGRLRAKGYEAGPVVFRSHMADGVHSMEIVELGLYGGTVRAAVAADGSGDALAIDASLDIESVAVAGLAEAAAMPVSGVAAGTVRASGRGTSPRALAESLVAEVDLALTGIDMDALAGVSEVALAASLPGLDGGAPKANGGVVYNGERVAFTLALAPLRQVLGDDRFDLDLTLASRLFDAAYDGAVQRRPAPGLAGALTAGTGSLGALAAWLGLPFADRPDPGPLRLEATLASEGTTVALSDAAIESDAVSATASGRFDGEARTFDAALTIARLDTNALLPPPPEPVPGEPAQAPPAPPAEPGDWSDEPIELAALAAASGTVTVDARDVLYRDLRVEALKARASLAGGVLAAVVEELRLAGGTVSAEATLDGSGDGLGVTYAARGEGLQAKPLLATFAGTDRLLGTMAFAARGAARGASERALVASLAGDGSVRLTEGAIEGINIAARLRQLRTLDFGGAEAQRTDFSELGGTYTITGGVVDNRDLRMLAPLVRLDGAGVVPMPPRTIDYKVTAKLVPSLEGQGGVDALAGIPIPITISGPWHKPQRKVDWERVFDEIGKDPARVAALPVELAEKAAGLGVELPVAIIGKIGGVLEELPGGLLREVLPPATGEREGGPLDLLRDILPAPAPAPAPEEAQPAPAPEPAQEEPAPDPLGALRDLLGR